MTISPIVTKSGSTNARNGLGIELVARCFLVRVNRYHDCCLIKGADWWNYYPRIVIIHLRESDDVTPMIKDGTVAKPHTAL